MKKKKYFSSKMFLSIAVMLVMVGFIDASVTKWIRVGRVWDPVIDSGNQSMASPVYLYYYEDGFQNWNIDRRGFNVIMRDWTDEFGGAVPFMIAGHVHEAMDESINTVPVADEDDITIRKYVREQPPTVIVDGYVLNDPFPLSGEAIDPERIPGAGRVFVGR